MRFAQLLHRWPLGWQKTSALCGAALWVSGCFFSLEAPPTGDGDGDGDGDAVDTGGEGGVVGGGDGDGDGDGDEAGGTGPGGMTGMGGSLPEGCLDGTTFTDDFENGDDCWDPNVNSSWSIVNGGFDGSKGFAQKVSSDFVQAAETIGPENGWKDVRLEAKVKVTDWGTSDPSSSDMVGLFVRYLNNENFYYAALRGDGTLYIRKRTNRIDNESIGDSYSVPGGWELGQWYDIAIEVEENTLRLFFDGVERRAVTDDAITNRAQVAIGTYNSATAVFDNVRVTEIK